MGGLGSDTLVPSVMNLGGKERLILVGLSVWLFHGDC